MTDHPHCWHEAGGVPYQRHSGRPEGNVEVTCCRCGDVRSLPMHARARAGTPDPKVKHGDHLPAEEVV